MIDTSFGAIRNCGAVPHWFGLGFIQLKLNAKQRMHFWHPNHIRDTNEEEVHNHRYSYSSRIIIGEIVHETWAYVPSPSGEGNIECIEVSCKPDRHIEDKPLSIGSMTMDGHYNLPAGTSYFFPASGFHRIKAKRAVTVVCRGEIETENAMVLRRIGTPSFCPFSVKKTEAECWRIIEELLS
jgi:hypothetical protein